METVFIRSHGRYYLPTKGWKVIFIPIFDRSAKMDYKLILTDQHQVFGRFTGRAILDDGTELDIKDLICGVEVVHNKY